VRVQEKTTISIDEVKSNFGKNIGNKVSIVEYNKLGKIIKKTDGVITECYEMFVIIEQFINRFKIKKSFNYVDFLTKAINVKFCD